MKPRRTPLLHWLSLRVRLGCVAIFVLSLFLPPYVPPVSFALEEDEETGQFLFVEDGFLMKTSSLTEQGARRAFADGIFHTVEPNESIASIASFYGISAQTIRWANDMEDGDGIEPGQKLLILPVDGVVHRVTRGQNLSRIAQLYSVSVADIKTQNRLGDDYLLAGQELIIPGGEPLVEAPPVVVAQQPQPSPPVPQPPASGALPRQLEETPPSVRRQLYEAPASVGILQKPCECYYTQYFNSRHYAVDMQQRGGGPIFAAEAGTVSRSDTGWNGGYGNVIEIDHGNGLVTVYAHNKTNHVRVGDTVVRGQHISDMGNTGLVYGPTGIHLHFEVRVNGVKKNPILYLQ